ncbi:uncharacterized protein LOC135834057 [Planococcus citri]|uniref:uncharacterized protein LOC135834057 n=1 Tax=Planococcus citri TaxID=170843 RepID=UPI0031F79C47
MQSEIPPQQAGFTKGRGTREQILNIRMLIEKAQQPVAEKNQILNQDLEEKQILNRTPLVLTESLGALHFPKRVRITREHQKQEYYFSKERDGQYYCPIEHTKENEELLENIERLGREEYKYCLFKKKKSKKEEEPMCKDEVKPLILRIRDNIGQMKCGDGFLYKFAYEICTPKSVTGKALRWILWKKTPKADLFAYVDHPHLYEICYEHFTDSKDLKISGRVLFTEHKIRSPYLFRNLNLYDENAMHNISDHYSIETYGLDNLKSLNGNLQAFLKQPERPRQYELEMLVPSTDFALGHWKKATYHMINYAPLHGWGTYLWRNITAYVSGKLIQLYKKIGPIRIFTGTYGEFEYNRQKVYLGDDPVTRVPIPVIWWKLLYAEDKDPRKAVVVIMHAVKNLPKACKEETTACDISKWNLNLDHKIYHYIYVYCCNVSNAKDYITTIGQLRIPNLEKVELLELD